MIRSGLLATGVLVASTAVAGCSGDPDEPRDVSQGESSSPAPAAALEGAVPALKDLRVDACASGTGALTASGAVRNRSVKKPVDYLVTVNWLDETGTVLTTAEAAVEDVELRTTQEWTVKTDLDETASSCTTRLVRGILP